MKRRNKKRQAIQSRMVFIIGLLLCLYPVASHLLAQLDQTDLVDTYLNQSAQIDQAAIELAIEQAQQYNRLLYQTQGNAIGELKETLLSQEKYQALLNLSGNGVMASIEIPAIQVNLPVYHGTAEVVLQKGAGHVEMTSLPIGGVNTRCVLSGHRGLPSSWLFTRLDELEEGDLFYIHVFNQTLAYQVFEIKVIEPTAVEELRIVEGQDLVSLVTCTPYGINSHRLVVTGKRIAFEQQSYLDIQPSIPSLRETVLLILPLLFIFIAFLRWYLDRKEHQKSMRRNNSKKRRHTASVLLFVLLMTTSVQASEVGSIRIVLADTTDHCDKADVQFDLVQVAKIVDGQYVWRDDLAEVPLDLNHMETAEALKEAAKQLASLHLKADYVLKTDETGNCLQTNLAQGVYLLSVNDQADYEEMEPMLISLPYHLDQETLLYDVEITPKHQPLSETVPDTGIDDRSPYMVLAALASFGIAGWRYDVRKRKKQE